MKIAIISTYATDTLIKENNREQKKGGPLTFIERFLEKKNTPYDAYTGQAEVTIDMRQREERSIALSVIKQPPLPKETYDLAIISTILDEVPLRRYGKLNCLDIQGYVRDGKGGRRRCENTGINDFDIVKATNEEIAYIPETIKKKIPLLIVTKGKEGFSITKDGESKHYRGKSLETEDTLGAGDTLLAAFSCNYARTRDIDDSAEKALQAVESFLNSKGETMKKLQIGVMGSAADLNYTQALETTAEKVGELLAKKGCFVVYGAEKDYSSLSTAAARGAKKAGGTTIGVTYGKGKDIHDRRYTDIIISTGNDRGGGREFILVNSCDAIIAISGGSGTLTEMVIAYQSDIPIICLTGVGGWSDKLADNYIDDRKRRKCEAASTPEAAVELAIKQALEK